MKCLLCARFSLGLFCKKCHSIFELSPQKRVLDDGFIVYSFYDYKHIEFLLKTKYFLIGSRIYAILTNKAAKYFKNNIKQDFSFVYSIGIDDSVRSFYSHSGVIVKGFDEIFKPLYGALVAQNDIHYAGKSLQYRKENKKDFVYKGIKNINAVLIDDIITTGLSIQEARQTLLKHDVNVLFALTLSDARY